MALTKLTSVDKSVAKKLLVPVDAALAVHTADIETNTNSITDNTTAIAVNAAAIVTVAEGQTAGVIVFATYALLDAYTPATAQEKASFKVTDDSNTSLNGYYSWVSGTTYTKDADLVVNTIDENNTSDAVSGAAVAGYVEVDSAQRRGSFLATNADSIVNTDYKLGWVDAILKASGDLAFEGGGYSNTSPFISVIPAESHMTFIGIANHAGNPSVVGYSLDKSTVTVLATGDYSTFPTALTLFIPSDIYWIRVSSKDDPVGGKLHLDVTTQPKYHVDKLISDRLEREDPFTNGGQKEYSSTTGVINVNPNYRGTGYLPVEYQDIIQYKGYATNTGYCAVAGFDINKNFVAPVLESSIKDSVYYLTVDDPTIAYVMAAHLATTDLTTPFIKIDSSATIMDKLEELENGRINNAFYRYVDTSVLSAFSANSLITEVGEDTFIETVAAPAYVGSEPVGYPYRTYTIPISILVLECVAIPDGSPTVVVKYHTNTNTDTYTYMAVGDTATFTLYEGKASSNNLLVLPNNIGTKFKVISQASGWMDSRTFYPIIAYDTTQIEALLNNPNALLPTTGLSTLAVDSVNSRYVDTRLKGERLVCFGDSITFTGQSKGGWVYETGHQLGMPWTVLGDSGRTPQQIYADLYLLNLPLDSKIVTMTGGANANVVLAGDLTSRDRDTYEGCLNYAIDYVYATCPLARIIICPCHPLHGNQKTAFNDVMTDIAALRNITVADWFNDAGINLESLAVVSVDGVHMTEEGNARLAGVVIGTIKNISY